jgi:hypothetical protein
VAYKAVRESAKAENMPTIKYLWAGLDPTAVAVLMEVRAATDNSGRPLFDIGGTDSSAP